MIDLREAGTGTRSFCSLSGSSSVICSSDVAVRPSTDGLVFGAAGLVCALCRSIAGMGGSGCTGSGGGTHPSALHCFSTDGGFGKACLLLPSSFLPPPSHGFGLHAALQVVPFVSRH